MSAPASVKRLALAAASWAPTPGTVGAAVLLAVAMVLDLKALSVVVVAVALYGVAYDATLPELEHEYCPCKVCQTPPTAGGAA